MVTHEAMSLLTDHDLYLFNEGSHFRLYDKLGARVVTHAGTSGTFAVDSSVATLLDPVSLLVPAA